MKDSTPWGLTPAQSAALAERARAELVRIRQQPARSHGVAFLYERECEAIAWLLLGQLKEAGSAVRGLMEAWEQCVRSDNAFEQTFGLREDLPQSLEQRSWMAEVLVDGVELAIITGQVRHLERMRECLGESPRGTRRTGLADWTRELPLLRHLLLLHMGQYTASIAERKDCWEDWLEDGKVSESSLAWRGLQAVAEGDAKALSSIVSAWHAQQRLQLTNLSNHEPTSSGLRVELWPAWLLELLPACLLQLGRQRGLSLSTASYLNPATARLWGFPP